MNSWIHQLSLATFCAAAIVFSNFILRVLLKTPVVNFFCDKPDARKVHSKPIPRLGGTIIVFTFLIFMTALLLFKNTVGISIPFSKNIVQVLLLSSVIIFICGFLDDTTFITMRVRYKITAELIIALSAVYLFNIDFGHISIFSFFTMPLWVSKLLSVLWIMGLINAFNMIDGVDGLAGGISLISILTLAVIAYLGGLPSILAICLILTGAIIGFLLFNLPPAKTFMGDTGSLFLGTMIAVISLYLSKEIVTSRTMVMMILIAGVPIIEVIVTMVRRYFKAKDSGYNQFERLHSMVVADNSHIHHRLVYLGFSHLETTTMLCTLSFTLCCGALCLFLIPSYSSIFLLFYLAVPVVFVLDQLGFGGRFKKALHLSATRYNGYKKKSLVGVIDQEGTTFHLLKKQNNQDIEYVPITDEEISGISRYLKAVIVNKNSKDSENCIGYAEQVSTLIKGPIFIVSPDTTSKVSILEVFKNGSLNVKEKKGSILQLAKEMKKVSAGNVYTHH